MCRGTEESNPELADIPGGDLTKLGFGEFEVVEDIVHFRFEISPCRSQFHMPFGPFKKLYAKQFLHLFDLAAESWLGDKQALRCPTEVEFFGHGAEVFEVTEFDVHMLFMP